VMFGMPSKPSCCPRFQSLFLRNYLTMSGILF